MPGKHSRYLEIAADLRARILRGEWEPGSLLPRLDDLAPEYHANRDTVARAVKELEGENLVWAVPRRGTIIRLGMVRPYRRRGNLVKRNLATDEPGYSFPSASEQEVWEHHITPTATRETLDNERIAGLLKVPLGSKILLRHRLTGPATEPPFQINNSWIHPRVADLPGVTSQPASPGHPGPPGQWLYWIEKAGHWPIAWTEYHRARLPTKAEATELQIPVTFPVMEIVRVGTSAKDGEPVEVTEYVIPGDRVEQVMTLHRDGDAAGPWPEDSP